MPLPPRSKTLLRLPRIASFSTSPIPASPRNILITTPIFYVNAKPHIGHAYSAVLADAIGRWERIKGNRTRVLTGTDEHGQKIATAAAASSTAKLSPFSSAADTLEFCTRVSDTFASCFKTLNVEYDDFIRTTSPNHAEMVREMWTRLRPHIVKSHHEGWYCASDEAFVPSNQRVDEERKIIASTGQSVEYVSEMNYKFRFEPARVEEAVMSRVEIIPESRRNEVRHWFKELSAEPFAYISVSRPRHRVPWAIPVPDDPSQSVYVWLDALCSYLDAGGRDNGGERWWPPEYHILGKDISRFHAVYWPAFLLACGLELPRRLVIHSHWTCNKTKMSKSLGNVVDPVQVVREACAGEADFLRYFLLSNGRLEDDADFSLLQVREAVNNDLSDAIGNLVERIGADALWKTLPEGAVSSGECGPAAYETLLKLLASVDAYYTRGDFARGISEIMSEARNVNARFSRAAPWKLVKAEDSQEAQGELRRCLGETLLFLRLCGVLLAPVTPGVSHRLLVDRLGADLSLDFLHRHRRGDHVTIVKPRPAEKNAKLITKL